MSSGEDALDAADEEISGGDGWSPPWGDGSGRGWVLGIVLGALFALFEAVLGQFVSAGAALATALETAGGAFTFAGGRLGEALLEAFNVPFVVAADLAAGLGPFAPVFVGVAWALSAAFVGLLLYILWRVFTWI